jgi:hypothetical protein
VFEKRVLRRIFEPERMKRQEAEENCIMRSTIICTLQGTLLGR